jgi:hypothetical protein
MDAGKFSFKCSRQTQKNLVGSSKYAYFSIICPVFPDIFGTGCPGKPTATGPGSEECFLVVELKTREHSALLRRGLEGVGGARKG